MEREIVVKGHGRVRAMPDRAVIQVVVDAEAATREQAYGEAAGLAQRVDDVLAGRAPAIARTLTAGLSVHSRTRWKRGETVRTGWRAARSSTVDVIASAELGETRTETQRCQSLDGVIGLLCA